MLTCSTYYHKTSVSHNSYTSGSSSANKWLIRSLIETNETGRAANLAVEKEVQARLFSTGCETFRAIYSVAIKKYRY